MYIDSYALIVQQDGDGGDTLQREGMYAFGKWLRYNQETNTLFIAESPERQDPAKIISKFEIEPGIYIRHPDPRKWYSNPDTTSRDQVVPVIAYCGAYQDYPRLWRLFKATAKRGFFAQNIIRNGGGSQTPKIPDTMLGHLGLFIRAGGWYTAPLYPVLFITDFADLVATVLNAIPIQWQKNPGHLRLEELKDVDDNNTIIAHLMAVKFKPTPISWLNRQIYSISRGRNFGNIEMGESNPVMGSLVWYHRYEGRGNPEMAELYRPLIEEYFSPIENSQKFLERLAGYFNRNKRRMLSSNP